MLVGSVNKQTPNFKVDYLVSCYITVLLMLKNMSVNTITSTLRGLLSNSTLIP